MPRSYHQSLFNFILSLEREVISIPLTFFKENYPNERVGRMKSKDVDEVKLEINLCSENDRNALAAYYMFGEDIRNHGEFVLARVHFSKLSGMSVVVTFLLTRDRLIGDLDEGFSSAGYEYLKHMYTCNNRNKFLRECL